MEDYCPKKLILKVTTDSHRGYSKVWCVPSPLGRGEIDRNKKVSTAKVHRQGVHRALSRLTMESEPAVCFDPRYLPRIGRTHLLPRPSSPSSSSRGLLEALPPPPPGAPALPPSMDAGTGAAEHLFTNSSVLHKHLYDIRHYTNLECKFSDERS
eukprot:COSAG01_NODE_177_length_22954_cov_28.699554_7_plen_154_part_00